jgi:polyferredoxin
VRLDEEYRLMRVMRFLCYALLSLFALATLGSFVPSLSVLGELGPALTAFIGPWIVVLSLIGAIWA